MEEVTVEVKVKLKIRTKEGVEISEVIQEMDYSFTSQTDNAEIMDTEIRDFEVKDSR